jgi:hypothetical protein
MRNLVRLALAAAALVAVGAYAEALFARGDR